MKRNLLFCSCLLLLVTGCGSGHHPRMTMITGTIIGLHVSPGDASSHPPEVTFAYKRSELALIPTAAETAVNNGTNYNSDTYSAFSIFDADIHWFGTSTIEQLIATGHASRTLLSNPAFTACFGP